MTLDIDNPRILTAIAQVDLPDHPRSDHSNLILSVSTTLGNCYQVRGFLPLNQVQPASRLNNTTHLTRLESESRILELLLHVALAKVAQVTALASRGTVGLGGGEIAEGNGSALDSRLVGLNDLEGFFFGAGDVRLARLVSI